MTNSNEEWRPGSFTKNFSWGAPKDGLKQLHEIIRVGFDSKVEDVPRVLFRSRAMSSNRPDYIPINFFLFNRIFEGTDFILADELVFQAVNFKHSARFDKLALFAFNFSYVGTWKGAAPYQHHPALWARHYVTDRLSEVFQWDASKVNADDIENFVNGDSRYKAMGARKLATNLNYLYKIAKLDELSDKVVSRWWVDAVFLALDRLIENRKIIGANIDDNRFQSYLTASNFFALSGKRSIEKELASKHLVNLYVACGGTERFNDESVQGRLEVRAPELQRYIANDPNPIAALHPTNTKILKTIPRACAMLAKQIGFETFEIDALENLDTSDFVRQNVKTALDQLKKDGISSNVSAEELMRIMRDR